MKGFAVALALVVSLAVAGTAHAQTAHLSGTIVDPSEAALPAVTVTVDRIDPAERSTRTVATDREGRYEFRDLRPGTYTLSASLPGFETFSARMMPNAGDEIERNIVLQVGSLHETITVTSTDIPAPPRRAPVPPPPPPPAPPAAPAGAVRVGGNIKAPTKIADVHPIYPAALAAQSVEGAVTLAAIIGPDGFVRDIKVLATTNDEFSRAASDAVSQWQFTPTLLNGNPIDVRMGVSVYFKK